MGRVQTGDGEAFTSLVERHQGALQRYLTRVLGCPDRAAELAQETFIRAFQHAGRYEPTGPFATWLFTIATNRARQELRRQRRWRFVPLLPGPAEGNGHGPIPAQPEATLLREELTVRLEAAVAALPARFRLPVVLRDVEGKSYDEIGRILGCRLGTVKSRVNRGRHLLKTRLRCYLENDA